MGETLSKNYIIVKIFKKYLPKSYLTDRNLPDDEITMAELTEEILTNPPEQGYLTISNALQWRLQYKRIVELRENVKGIIPIITNERKKL